MAINLTGVVRNIGKTNVYTPIIEAIVNSIDAIEQSGRTDGKIIVRIKRNDQQELEIGEDVLAPINSIDIIDNGTGFNQKNRDSFDELYSEQKITKGGKGFGRFIFLKYFDSVQCDSTYQDGEKFFRRKFDFGVDNQIIANEDLSEVIEQSSATTVVSLHNLKEEYSHRLNKNLDTIARKIVEKLLIFFVDENYSCPEIVLQEDATGEEVTLNRFLTESDQIIKVADTVFEIPTKDGNKEQFALKIFKIYYVQKAGTVSLAAHNREVTETALWKYIPEFKDGFYDKAQSEEESNKNYTIKAYVLGNFLDKHVSLERSEFNFPKTKNLFSELGQEDIESEAVNITKDNFLSEVTVRQEKKKDKIQQYVEDEAPWHKSVLSELDLNKIPYDASEHEIETALHTIKFEKEQAVKASVKQILESDDEFEAKFKEVVGQITEVGKTDLAHYVALRKNVLDIFRKSLEKKEDGKYQLEKTVHDIIFPTKSDSEDTPYEQHNLWLIDERLSFHHYLASDKPLNSGDDRPDLLLFDKKILVRDSNEHANPIVVFEFKRPQRDDYTDEDDPIKQIGRYVKKIRAGNYKTPEGRDIKATENTPAYGFVVCDLTPKIEEFCIANSMTKSPDLEGYFGYHVGYKIYFEIISFDKLVKDSELRNKIFFKKLGIA